MGPIRRAALSLLAVATAVTGVVATGGAPTGAAAGEHCYIVRVHEVFLGRAPTATEIATWTGALASGTPRWSLPQRLAHSDEWLGVEVTRLYRQALDRDPDAAGLAYWTGELRRGVMVTRAASLVYGSPEFATRAGGTDPLVITDLYRRLLHRAPTAGELGYWIGQRTHRTYGGIAADLVFSPESRTDRVTAQFAAVLGRVPDASGLAYWVARLRTVNDVRLAMDLAASPEMFDRAQVGCTEPPPTSPPPPPPPPSVDAPVGPASSYVFDGRGWGHGRGMSQWGALGYAVDHGWSTEQILGHYYGGTVAGTMPSNSRQRVYLVGSAGTDLTVTQSAGRLRVDGSGADWAAVRVARLSSTTFRVYGATSASCTPTWTLLRDTTATDVGVVSSVAQEDTASRMLRDCRTGRSYRGSLHNVRTGGTAGSAVVNQVDTEGLVRGVVPHEVSPSWVSAGSGRGAAAVRAQAVAARSYVAAGDSRWGSWATTCDTATCQVYGGFGAEDSRTDAAVVATAHQVRLAASGAVARTEFASSSGGWTAGGAFPAVVDDGDDYAGNPYHEWRVVVTRTAVEAAYSGRGSFQGFAVAARSGTGELGGRVVRVELRFSGGTLVQTGDQVRQRLGLRSDWWAVAA